MTIIALTAKRIADELDAAMRAYVAEDGSRGITQRRLSHLSGVPQPTISRTLSAQSIPETDTLTKLSRALRAKIGGYDAAPDVTVLSASEPDVDVYRAAIDLMRSMSHEGRYVALGELRRMAREFQPPKANHSS